MGIAERVKRQQDVDGLDEAPPHGATKETRKRGKPGEPETVSVEYVEHEHRDLTDAERAAALGYDPAVWEIVAASAWNGQMKLTGSNESGATWSRPVVVWMYRYTFRRKLPQYVETRERSILDGWKPPKVPAPRRHKRGAKPDLLLVSLYDVHFGKLAWSGETEAQDFDTKIAAERFGEAIAEMCEFYANHRIERIFLPVGNDFFHIDSWAGKTTNETAIDFDSRFPKVYDTGAEAMQLAVRALREIAPVDVKYVPGNHDRTASWHLCRELGLLYDRDKYVTVDRKPNRLKWLEHGRSLVVSTHGDKPMKPTALALTASSHCPAWSLAKFRYIVCGHLHGNETATVRLDEKEIKGTRIHRVPSLSETDAWHYWNDFTGNHPAAMAFVYDRDYGLHETKEFRVKDDGNSG